MKHEHQTDNNHQDGLSQSQSRDHYRYPKVPPVESDDSELEAARNDSRQIGLPL